MISATNTLFSFLRCFSERVSKHCAYLALGCALFGLTHLSIAASGGGRGSPFDRTGVPWPKDASADAVFRDVLVSLAKNNQVQVENGRTFPGVWEDRLSLLLPEQQGWVGFSRNGEYGAWRTIDQQLHPITAEVIKKLTNQSPLGGISGVVVHKSALCGVVVDRRDDPRTHVLAGSRLVLVDLESGVVADERAFESEARATASPSGRQLAVLLPIAPVEGRMMSETSGAPPSDETARGAASSALRILDVDDLSEVVAISAHYGVGCKEIGFSPDEKLIWSRDSVDVVRVFSRLDGHRIGGTFNLPPKSLVAVSDGGLLVVGFAGELRAYEVRTGIQIAQKLAAHFRQIVALAVRPGKEEFATLGADGTLRTWTLPQLSLLSQRDAPIAPVDSGSNHLYFITSNLLVSAPLEYGGEPKPVLFVPWQSSSLPAEATLYTEGQYSSVIGLSPDGAYLAVGDQGQGITFYDNHTARRIKTVRSPIKDCSSIAVPWNQPVAVVGNYSKEFAYASAGDSLTREQSLDQFPKQNLQRWPKVSIETKLGVFSSTENLDWICTFAGRAIRGGSAGFARGTPQPLGWVCIGQTEYCAAIGYDWMLIYAPQKQQIIQVYRFLSPAGHAVFDPVHRCLLVTHQDGAIRRWLLPKHVAAEL
jgi:WD40 repeat protein